ncbi:MAG TPA: tripartite tricarboxylate transporter substrate binding protein [Burkholderiales bacterium]|nr:tripartite tricarboxylate transporter substrate binding protein [Burkholderiales bacterium]
MKRLSGQLVIATLAICGAAQCLAQQYPVKPIRIVIPYAPGGGTDVTARMLAPHLTERWKQPVIVDSRPGGAGMIGADHVAKSAPDGYTILLAVSPELALNVPLFKKMPYDPVRDFQPVTLLGTSPPVFLAHPSLPVKSVKEFIALARTRPGALSYATPGVGQPHHFAGELIKMSLKIDWTHIPYKGAGPQLIDMAGGHVPLGFAAATVALPYVKAGRLRGLAVASAKRSAVAPDIPTISETAIPGFDIVQWYGVMVPAKTPKDIVDRLHAEFVRIAHTDDFKQKWLAAATEVVGSTPEELARFQLSEIEKYRKIAQAAGMKPE